MPEAKFYQQKCVPGDKVTQFCVLSRELHAFPVKFTHYDATSGVTKACVEIFETTKKRRKGLLKFAVYLEIKRDLPGS